jgi:Hemerythrin HHE cation binding domain
MFHIMLCPPRAIVAGLAAADALASVDGNKMTVGNLCVAASLHRTPAGEKSMAKKNDIERAAKARSVAKAKALAPDRSTRIGSTPQTKFRGDPAIFGRLVEDHDRHRALFAMLEDSEPGSDDRSALFLELTRELKAHAAAEEQALWSSVLRNPATTDDGRHAVAEHKQIDEMLADLAARDSSKKGWAKRLEALKHKYLHHLREEEQEQFVSAEATLSAADRKYMLGVFNRRKREEKAAAKPEPKISLKPIAVGAD